MKKISATAVLLFCILIETMAQSNVSIWTNKFDSYQALWPKTRLHLTFNQDKFSPGDTAYFKAYFLYENLSGVAGKQLIDLNLVDSRGETKLHFLFNVNDGLGFNQIAIPDTVSAGIYYVTAQSNWMKNFDPVPFFKKKIVIVRKNNVESDEKTSLIVVPEGGHIVRDVTNKIVIRTNRPAPVIQLVDAAGLEIGKCSADLQGFGSITFKPARKTSYFVQIVGDPSKTSLSVTENDGCSILLTPSSKELPVKVLVALPPSSSHRDEEHIMIVSARGKIYQSTPFRQDNHEFVELEISQKNLPEGIAHISVLDRSGELLASRDFYSQGENQVQAKIQVAKNYFQTREKVRLEISLSDDKGKPVEGEFAVSVLNSELFNTEKQNTISDELNIFADLGLSFNNDRSDPNWITSLDNYLISATEEVPWKEILSRKITKPSFPMSSVIQKSGTAYFGDTGEAVPELTQVMLYLQKDRKSYHTFTSAKGKIGLAIFDVTGKDELFYSAAVNGQEIPNLRIDWEEEPVKLPSSIQSKETQNPDRYAAFASKMRLIDRSFGFYTAPPGSKTNTSIFLERTFEDEIKGGADVSVRVQDYIIFATMEELIKEVIPSLRTRKEGSKTIVRVTLPEPLVPTDDPVYIIDGIATRNTELFLSLKPADLLTVKVIRERIKTAPFSLMGRNGIVIVQTKKGNVREPLNDLSKVIEGVNQPVDFKVREYSAVQDKHRPDFRSTIHWNPSIKTDSNGKATVEFFCSDDVGKMRVHIDGLATEGKGFSASIELEVDLGPEKK